MGDDERRWVSGAQTYIANCLEIVQPRLLDTKMVVDRRVFLDKGIRGRHIGFWLVVVVVGHEVLDRIVRKKLAELAV